MHKLSELYLYSKKYAASSVLFACVMLLVLAELGGVIPAAVPADVATSSVETAGTHEEKILPVQLRIPKINLETTFTDPLGVRPDGEIAVPEGYDEVGWYQYGPAPGQLGPAVVLGHVDSTAGPAVFYSLGQLDAGDDIFITLADGSEVQFVITDSGRYEQTAFPTQLVYGDIDHAGLRLITCSGWYDRESERYSHNTVVYARLQQ